MKEAYEDVFNLFKTPHETEITQYYFSIYRREKMRAGFAFMRDSKKGLHTSIWFNGRWHRLKPITLLTLMALEAMCADGLDWVGARSSDRYHEETLRKVFKEPQIPWGAIGGILLESTEGCIFEVTFPYDVSYVTPGGEEVREVSIYVSANANPPINHKITRNELLGFRCSLLENIEETKERIIEQAKKDILRA